MANSTYAFQSPIEAQQYNNLVWGSDAGGGLVTTSNNLNMIWGPGYGAKGINQGMSAVTNTNSGNAGTGTVTVGQNVISYNNTTGSLTQVGASGVVTSQQWIGLISAVNSLMSYQGKAAYSLATFPGIQQKISAYEQIQTYLNSGASGMGTGGAPVAQSLSGQTQAVTWTAPADLTTRTLTATTSLQWPTGDDARWFFNAGGYIQISVAGKGSVDARSAAIANMLNNVGYVAIRANDSGGTMYTGGTGYWNTTINTATQVYNKNTGLGVYTGSYVAVSLLLDSTGSAGTRNGANGNRLNITVYIESHTASAFTGTDAISAELDITWQVFDPAASGSYTNVSKTWQSPTVNAATYSTT
jgi:hypothetical protein